ncbi:hypothetical protein GE09DRAFT_1052467 [Coniochaeta sp. 2T2.1]|nr:hypothetical protein GE09DRAFT_1052467 [Coniochaeta sp. 2T2.1]
MGSVSEFSEDTALATFDKLVDEGVINYGASFPTYHTVDGFEFELRHRPSWQTKPRIPTDSSASDPKQEPFGPGSDILKSHPSQALAHLSQTHILVLNIYPSSRPHYLILTLDSFARQDTPLSAPDVRVTWDFLQSLAKPGEYYVMYNCAPASGCSRQHKHLQVARRHQQPVSGDGGERATRLWPDIGIGWREKEEEEVKVPYRYFLHRFPPTSSSSGRGLSVEYVYHYYASFLRDCRTALLGGGSEEEVCPPHNLILTSEWILMIPRRYPEEESYMELLPNGAGMMGMVSSPRRQILDRWVQEGPAKVLRMFGLPPEEKT